MLATRVFKDVKGRYFRLLEPHLRVWCDARGNKLHGTGTCEIPHGLVHDVASWRQVGTWEGFNQEGF